MRAPYGSAVVVLLLFTACQDDAPRAPSAPTAAEPAPQLASAEPTAVPATDAPTTDVPTNGAAGVLKTVSFPGGDLPLPESWSPKVRSEPPMTAVHVMPMTGMTCDLAVLEGHGTQKQAEEYLAAGANAYNGDTARAPGIEVGGHAFQGIHVTNPKALPNATDALVEVYAAIAGDDLVGIGVTRLEKAPTLDDGRRKCLQAFAQLTAQLPRAQPTGE